MANRPLAGVRVLDLSRVFAGPVAGRVLADLGADVVKVEPPEGDVSRLWGRPTAGLSTYFTQQNCGKRDVSIDMRRPGGPELIADLASAADVLIENFRPGVLARHGVDWAVLSELNQRLIMLSISGFGQDGPESQRAAYAAVIHAEAGLVRQGEGQESVDVTFSAADVLSGMHGVVGVMAALRVRDATGLGQHIDLAMMDAMTFSNDNVMHSLDGKFAEPKSGDVWQTASGPVMLTGGLRWIWHQMSAVHGLIDPTPKDGELAEKLTSRRRVVTDFLCALPDRSSVLQALDDAGLAWGELRQLRGVIESPTLQSRGSIVSIDDRAGGTREVVRSPYRMSVSETDDIGHAAHQGEHNHAVLRDWLAVEPERVDELLANEVLVEDEWAEAARTGKAARS